MVDDNLLAVDSITNQTARSVLAWLTMLIQKNEANIADAESERKKSEKKNKK